MSNLRRGRGPIQPPTEPEKMARIKLQVRSGTYVIKPDQVAQAMLDHALGVTDKLIWKPLPSVSMPRHSQAS